MVRVMIAQLKHRLFAIPESVRSGTHAAFSKIQDVERARHVW
jgi:hypothetical protein